MEKTDYSPVLKGLRRDLTRGVFEELGALYCTPEEIMGYIGTDLQHLEIWCRNVYGPAFSLEEVLGMVRQDGRVAIRRALFHLQEKNASLVSQQVNRFLPDPDLEKIRQEDAVQAFTAMLEAADESAVEELFPE